MLSFNSISFYISLYISFYTSLYISFYILFYISFISFSISFISLIDVLACAGCQNYFVVGALQLVCKLCNHTYCTNCEKSNLNKIEFYPTMLGIVNKGHGGIMLILLLSLLLLSLLLLSLLLLSLLLLSLLLVLTVLGNDLFLVKGCGKCSKSIAKFKRKISFEKNFQSCVTF
jgi:hypothetical protein